MAGRRGRGRCDGGGYCAGDARGIRLFEPGDIVLGVIVVDQRVGQHGRRRGPDPKARPDDAHGPVRIDRQGLEVGPDLIEVAMLEVGLAVGQRHQAGGGTEWSVG